MIIIAEYWLLTDEDMPEGFRLLGDVNEDGIVNLQDIAFLSDNWLGSFN